MEDCVSVHVGTTEGPSVPPTNRLNRVINTISLMVFFQKKERNENRTCENMVLLF